MISALITGLSARHFRSRIPESPVRISWDQEDVEGRDPRQPP